MGVIYKPEDMKRRRTIDKALEDLDPSIRDAAKRLMESYKGEDLERKLAELIGLEKMRKLKEKK